MQYKEFSDKFWQLLGDAKSILITSHMDPDDDAIASVLSTYLVIKQKYPEKEVRMVFSSEVSNRWSYFENFEKIESGKDLTEVIEQFDLTIFLDGNYLERFTKNPELLAKYSGKKICIDHHASNPMSLDASLIEEDATSTSELIYFSLVEMEPKIDRRLCEALLMGVMADTGGFQFVDFKRARVFEMAKRLTEEGRLDINELRVRYSGMSERVFGIVAEFAKNSRVEEISPWPKFVSSFITGDFAKGGNYTSLEVDEAAGIFTSYLTSINEAGWGIVARPSGERVKVSLRAKPNTINVREIAERMGKGSGHDLSAGIKFDPQNGEVPDVRSCLLEITGFLKENRP
jgi:bifunctional oligoribonuclease and PAP phosphatase NrnA